MSANTFGQRYRVTSFGESHGPAVGVVIDGLRPGIPIDLEAVQRELDRRRPGRSALSSPRNEADRLEVLSGVFEGKTTGAPIAIVVRNADPKSQHYDTLRALFRPGHADYTFFAKYGIRDYRGGGRSSGRETVSRVAAGAIARQLLAERGVRIRGHVVRIGEVSAPSYGERDGQLDDAQTEATPTRCADAEAAAQMEQGVLAARKEGDSLGGVVEVIAEGVPAGWGDPVYAKLDAQIASAMVSIGAVKGVEFGAGFALTPRRGSESNDALLPGDGAGLPPRFASNHMGGVLGGISSGQPIICRLAIKPTSSIRHEQQTITTTGEATTVRVPGRHDPCICPRVVPVAEAMMALVLCDAYLAQQALSEADERDGDLAAELASCEAELLALLARHRELSSRGEVTGDAREALLGARRATAAELNLNLDPEVFDRLLAQLLEEDA
ncbi:MAG: chorismate synthase [Proteobacteria bacterium]|nr:MAG: chorismate synthase [Pseudomonadota bacterium]PIE17831.1 MAG: chorismate synthase [Pseudomonadota bacterium]